MDGRAGIGEGGSLRSAGNRCRDRRGEIVFPSELLDQVCGRSVLKAHAAGAGRVACKNELVIVGAKIEYRRRDSGRIAPRIQIVDRIGDVGEGIGGVDGRGFPVDDDVAGVTAPEGGRLAGKGIGTQGLRLRQIRNIDSV